MSAPLSPMSRLRYDVIRRLLAKAPDAVSFLEVGCGQGALATLLATRYEYVGYEPDAVSHAVAEARLTGLAPSRVVNGMLPDEPDREFDVVGAFEVLEHLEHDGDSLAAWVRWVRPNGLVLLSVPAHPDRFGPADEAVGHFRRYTRDGLRRLMSGAGLVDVQTFMYGFPLGYALEWTRNRLLTRSARAPAEPFDSRTAASGRTLQPGAKLGPLIHAGTVPFALMQRPFAARNIGTGLVAQARRPT